jgi:hypothetical protein
MAPPIKQENLPPLEDCRLLLKNAVNVKLNASANFKLTATDALVIAGFDPEVAKNQSPSPRPPSSWLPLRTTSSTRYNTRRPDRPSPPSLTVNAEPARASPLSS